DPPNGNPATVRRQFYPHSDRRPIETIAQLKGESFVGQHGSRSRNSLRLLPVLFRKHSVQRSKKFRLQHIFFLPSRGQGLSSARLPAIQKGRRIPTTFRRSMRRPFR